MAQPIAGAGQRILGRLDRFRRAGVLSLTSAMAAELALRGIRVNGNLVSGPALTIAFVKKRRSSSIRRQRGYAR